jgi:hypothetical protein
MSWAIRVLLVVRGGQTFWIDESTYLGAWIPLRSLAHREYARAAAQFFENSGNVGFSLLCTAVAPLHFLLLKLSGFPVSDPAALRFSVSATSWIPALVFSLSSVAVIGLTYAVASRAGALEEEAISAALLAAGSSALFYYSRHLLPYDTALALALLALWIGLRPQPRLRESFACGALAAAAFLTYPGYWSLAGVIIAAPLFWHRRRIPARFAACAVGFASLPLLVEVFTYVSTGRSFVQMLSAYSRTITQGDFAEGWSLPWAYLWSAEHGILLLWIAALIVGAIVAAKATDRVRRLFLWGLIATALYASLVVTSTGLHKFVVYGRTARQLVPFLCLGAACGVAQIVRRRRIPRVALAAAMLLFALQVGWNFAGPLRQRFPDELVRETIARYGAVRDVVTTSGAGGELTACTPAVSWPPYKSPASGLLLVNTCRIAGPPASAVRPQWGTALWQHDHPLQFRPYQFEGLPQAERRNVSSAIQMLLVQH